MNRLQRLNPAKFTGRRSLVTGLIVLAIILPFVVPPAVVVQAVLALQNCQSLGRQFLYTAGEALGQNHKLRFTADNKESALAWQQKARSRFAELLFPHSAHPVPLEPKVLEEKKDNLVLTKVSLATDEHHRETVWTAVKGNTTPRGIIICFPGHYGFASDVVEGTGMYGYGTKFAENGFLVIAPDLAGHDIAQKGWSLEGQRVWDALRAADYAFTLDASKKGVAVMGHSLGGELAAYTAALDPRIKFVVVAGYLAQVGTMLDVSHCQCWNYDGYLENFSISDIYACIAPRPLVCELGAEEIGRNCFPIEQAHEPFREICRAYKAFGAEDNVSLHLHSRNHIYGGQGIMEMLDAAFPIN